MSGISFTSLEPPIDFSNGDSLNDSSPQQRDFGDTEEQIGEAGSELPEADDISDNGTSEANQKVDLNLGSVERIVEKTSDLPASNEIETVAKRTELCFAESNNNVAEADDSLPIVEQPDPGPLLRCPYLDEIPDSCSRYITEPFVHLLSCITNNPFTCMLI